jgi:hypothetical protein
VTTLSAIRRVFRPLPLAVALLALLAGLAIAQQDAVVEIDLPADGPQHSFGSWLVGELADDRLTTRWPEVERQGRPDSPPATIVAWTRPNRAGGDAKRLRAQVRDGRGMVFVIGPGEQHIREARTIWGPLDVNIQRQQGGTSDARWVAHPLTEGGRSIGAVEAGTSISGDGGSPLIRAGGQTVAMAFDWGPLGRAVILDSSVIFDELHEASPRPALRDFLTRSIEWTAGLDSVESPGLPTPGDRPAVRDVPGTPPVEAPVSDRVLIAMPDSGDNWAEITRMVIPELERRNLNLRSARATGDEPFFTDDRLDRTGLLVLGSDRTEVHWTEPMAIARYLEQGGRILCVPHVDRRNQPRMIALNQLLSQLRITVSLGRRGGQIVLGDHQITERVTMPDDLRADGGTQVWAPLTTPLVRVDNRPAAVAWQHGDGRIVIIDGELLRLQEGRGQPHRDIRTLLRRSLDWLMGDL